MYWQLLMGRSESAPGAFRLARRTTACVAVTLFGLACSPRLEVALVGDTAVSASVSTNTALPAPTAVARVAFRIPDESEVRDTVVLASVRRGRALLNHTRDSLPNHVGNALVCTNCHLQFGTVKHGMSWVGVYARFPQYRSRAGATQIIEDRVNDCIKRSLNGTPLPSGIARHARHRGLHGIPFHGLPGRSRDRGAGTAEAGAAHGRYGERRRRSSRARCARCHGDAGEGTSTAPPVWGPASFNIGAGMARVRTAATFIKHWMPQDSAGVLSAQEAFDVATFIDSRPRPDFKGKERDWPHGDPPPDVAYATDAVRRKTAVTR